MLSNDEALVKSLNWLLEEEGGFSNHPADTGGATMYGVTQATYDAYRTSKGLPKRSVKLITHDETVDLYSVMYWKPAYCDKLPWPISYLVFDASVNSGPVRAAKWLQEAVGAAQDGVVGRKTLDAVAASKDLIYHLVDVRLNFIVNLVRNSPSQMVFLLGWMRRLLRISIRALKENPSNG